MARVTFIDILCIQETHVENYFVSKNIENILGFRHAKFIWSYGQKDSKGTLIIIINESIHIEQFQTDFIGRLCYVDFQ